MERTVANARARASRGFPEAPFLERMKSPENPGRLTFHRAGTEGRVVEVTALDGLLAVEIGVATHLSIEAGRPVTLDELD